MKKSDFAKHFASSLQSQVNCLNQGGSCTPTGECPPGKKIGDCSLPAHVCCKSHTSPTAHGGSDNQQGVGDSYSNSVSKKPLLSTLTMICCAIFFDLSSISD